VLGRVIDLLHGEGRLLITTIWPEQWATYTAAARGGSGPGDATGTAGRLLQPLPELNARYLATVDPALGGVIDVPDEFTADELAAAAHTGDPVLAAAAAAAAADAGHAGQVTQYLAGVPDLLDRYNGPGGDPYGQAIITAAMDATRLGHAGLLPAGLVLDAAVGYLTDLQRTNPIAAWGDAALAWATAELRGAVQALQPVPPLSGTGIVGYQVSDYLDQHGRLTRREQLGPPSLWDALTTYTATPSDLARVGDAADDRGLYRQAAILWTKAANLGRADTASKLIRVLHHVRSGDTLDAARWTANHVSLDDARDIYDLQQAINSSGATDAANRLAARAASHTYPDDSPSGWELLGLIASNA